MIDLESIEIDNKLNSLVSRETELNPAGQEFTEENYEQKINKIMTILDRNRSGTINLKELTILYDDAEFLFKHFDSDQSGVLDVEQFKNLIYTDTLATEALNKLQTQEDKYQHNIQQIMSILDKDKSGTINMEELKKLYDDAEFLFQRFDSDQNGVLDLAEFRNLLDTNRLAAETLNKLQKEIRQPSAIFETHVHQLSKFKMQWRERILHYENDSIRVLTTDGQLKKEYSQMKTQRQIKFDDSQLIMIFNDYFNADEKTIRFQNQEDYTMWKNEFEKNATTDCNWTQHENETLMMLAKLEPFVDNWKHIGEQVNHTAKEATERYLMLINDTTETLEFDETGKINWNQIKNVIQMGTTLLIIAGKIAAAGL